MAATPNDLKYFNRGEPFGGAQGKTVSTFDFQYFRRGEPLRYQAPAPPAVGKPPIGRGFGA